MRFASLCPSMLNFFLFMSMTMAALSMPVSHPAAVTDLQLKVKGESKPDPKEFPFLVQGTIQARLLSVPRPIKTRPETRKHRVRPFFVSKPVQHFHRSAGKTRTSKSISIPTLRSPPSSAMPRPPPILLTAILRCPPFPLLGVRRAACSMG